jgi:cytochrome c551/c552
MFLATYKGLDPGGLTMAVYDKLLTSAGPSNASTAQEYDDDMVRNIALQKTNRKEIVGIWYKTVFPPVRLDDNG